MVTSLSHVTLENTSIGKVSLPAGTSVIYLMKNLNYDETFWGDPYTFRLEHFLDGSGNIPPDNPRRKHLLPFEVGPRVLRRGSIRYKTTIHFSC